uniref:Uncharacterized protein n=1 Tax=Equus asinus asinus TaxID=83772 RepID=A0A8C4MXY6_EQUAS
MIWGKSIQTEKTASAKILGQSGYDGGPQLCHFTSFSFSTSGPQDYRKFWAGLRGLTLYFYKSNRDSQHVEKLDLGTFVKFMDEAPWGSAQDPGIHFSLVLRNQEVKFKVGTLVGLVGDPPSPSCPPSAHTGVESESTTGLETPGKSLKLSGPQFPQLQSGTICLKCPGQDLTHEDHHCYHSVFQRKRLSPYCVPDTLLVAQP